MMKKTNDPLLTFGTIESFVKIRRCQIGLFECENGKAFTSANLMKLHGTGFEKYILTQYYQSSIMGRIRMCRQKYITKKNQYLIEILLVKKP